MIDLVSVQAALRAADPYDAMDRLVRAELSRGRKTDHIVDDFRPILDAARATPGLTDDGEEALLTTLDALTGNCRPDQCYQEPPEAATVPLLPRPSGDAVSATPR